MDPFRDDLEFLLQADRGLAVKCHVVEEGGWQSDDTWGRGWSAAQRAKSDLLWQVAEEARSRPEERLLVVSDDRQRPKVGGEPIGECFRR